MIFTSNFSLLQVMAICRIVPSSRLTSYVLSPIFSLKELCSWTTDTTIKVASDVLSVSFKPELGKIYDNRIYKSQFTEYCTVAT